MKVDKKRTATVVNHIKMFRCLSSHYVRKTCTAQFLPHELSISEMHRMYLDHCREMNLTPENFDFYKRVFNSSFHLKFGKLKKDQCNTCSTYLNGEKTDEKTEKHDKHLRDKDLARDLKNKKKEEAEQIEEVVAAAFDLEQVLLSPYGGTDAFYYSRRLKNHNFTVTELNTMNTYCYLWNECEGAKGSCEMATGVQNFISIKQNEGAKKIYFFSDRCGGQNLNRYMIIMLSHSVIEFELDFIELTFLVSGHSQNENDTAHSTIERNYRGKTIYTTAQWESTIIQAFKKNEASIKTFMHEDFIDFKNEKAFPQYSMVYADKIMDKSKKKVMWSKIVQAKFTSDGSMAFKYSYVDKFETVRLTTPGTRGMRGKQKKVDMRKYKAPLGITAAKKKDLLKLCTKEHIPKSHHEFYYSMPTNSAKDDGVVEVTD